MSRSMIAGMKQITTVRARMVKVLQSHADRKVLIVSIVAEVKRQSRTSQMVCPGLCVITVELQFAIW